MTDDRFMTRLAVFVVLYNEQGEVLLQQRGPQSYLGGYWDFPSGHVERGEDMRTAAGRELAEETDLVVSSDDLSLVHVDHYSLNFDYVNFVFIAKSWSGKPNILEPDKCSDMAWFNPAALPEKCVNVVRVFERAGFGTSGELTYSVTDEKSYESLMGEPLRNGGLNG
jgi:mutator protein MutT